MSEQSQEIGKLASALAKAQGKIVGATKDSKNPFFKSSYADLASVWDAIRGPLSENGLSVIQTTEISDAGAIVVTTLAHESGEWMRGKICMHPKDEGPQAYGSCLTYARRYALAAIVGVAQIDDDAEAATGRNSQSGRTPLNPRDGLEQVDPSRVEPWLKKVADVMQLEPEARAAKIFAIHEDLCPDEALYVAVGDALVEKGIASKALWKQMVSMGGKAKKAA